MVGWTEVSCVENGEMVLFGSIVDQAALVGILNKLARLNLTILAVNKVQKNRKWRQNENNANHQS